MTLSHFSFLILLPFLAKAESTITSYKSKAHNLIVLVEVTSVRTVEKLLPTLFTNCEIPIRYRDQFVTLDMQSLISNYITL